MPRGLVRVSLLLRPNAPRQWSAREKCFLFCMGVGLPTPEQPFSPCLPCRRLVLSLSGRGRVVRPVCSERRRLAQSSLNHDEPVLPGQLDGGAASDGAIPASRLYALNGFKFSGSGSASTSWGAPNPDDVRRRAREKQRTAGVGLNVGRPQNTGHPVMNGFIF